MDPKAQLGRQVRPVHREFRESSVRRVRLARKVLQGILDRPVRLLWAA